MSAADLLRHRFLSEVSTWDRAWNSLGEPRGPLNRHRDDFLDHINHPSDDEILKIKDIEEYDYTERERA